MYSVMLPGRVFFEIIAFFQHLTQVRSPALPTIDVPGRTAGGFCPTIFLPSDYQPSVVRAHIVNPNIVVCPGHRVHDVDGRAWQRAAGYAEGVFRRSPTRLHGDHPRHAHATGSAVVGAVIRYHLRRGEHVSVRLASLKFARHKLEPVSGIRALCGIRVVVRRAAQKTCRQRYPKSR